MEENERDLVEFEDESGNKITMEVMDYLFFEGKEYALLCEMNDGECDDCDKDIDCEDCENKREAYIMEVVPVGEDMEEFVPVDEALAEKLIDIFDNPEELEEEFEDE